MSYAPIAGTGTGSAPVVNLVWPFINQDHVKATVNGSPVTLNWTGAAQVTFAAVVAVGASWRVYRDTPSEAIVDFTDGAILLETDLDTSQKQCLYRSEELANVAVTGADANLRADLAGVGGAGLVGAPLGGTLQSKVFGTNLGQLGPGVIGDMVVTRQFSGDPGGTSGLYGINHQMVANGPNAIDSVRSLYIGTNVDTNANLVEAAHFFTWMKANRTAVTVKTVEAHFVTDTGVTVTEGNVFNTAGVVIGAGSNITKLIGYNAGALTSGTTVQASYGFNAEHNDAVGETVGFRSQQRSLTSGWSYLANTNDGSLAAPAGLNCMVKIGGEAQGATPNAPAYWLDVLAAADDYSARIANRTGSNPFGLRIQYTAAAPNDTSHDFIHAEDNVAVRFQVASNGNVSINGSRVLTSRQTGTPANATDLASAIALVNDLKAKLVQHGLIS